MRQQRKFASVAQFLFEFNELGFVSLKELVREVTYLYKGGIETSYLENLTIEEFMEEMEIIAKIREKYKNDLGF